MITGLSGIQYSPKMFNSKALAPFFLMCVGAGIYY